MSFILLCKCRSCPTHAYLALKKSHFPETVSSLTKSKVLSQEHLRLICFLARILTFMTMSRAAQTREGHLPCVCHYMSVFIHVLTISGCTTPYDVRSSRPCWLALCVTGIDSDQTNRAEPGSHGTTPWNCRFISGSCAHSGSVWYRHTL